MKRIFERENAEIIPHEGDLLFMSKRVCVSVGDKLYNPVARKISTSRKTGTVEAGVYVIHAATCDLGKKVALVPKSIFKRHGNTFDEITDEQWDEMWETLKGYMVDVEDRAKKASDFINWQKEFLNNLGRGDFVIPKFVELEIVEGLIINTNVGHE